MNQQDFGRLWQEASVAFHNYVSLTHATFRLLSELKKFPLSFEQRLEVIHQRQLGNAARERYQIAREALFNAAYGNAAGVVREAGPTLNADPASAEPN
jgi:hypothetical protein